MNADMKFGAYAEANNTLSMLELDLATKHGTWLRARQEDGAAIADGLAAQASAEAKLMSRYGNPAERPAILLASDPPNL